VTGTLTVGDGSTAFGFSDTPFSSYGSLSGDATSVGGRSVQVLSSSASGVSLFLAVTSNQNIFKTMYLMNADGTALVALNAADATFTNNSPSGTSRWSWSSPTNHWTVADVSETKRVGFLMP
jgi:hypothetical protein